MGEVLEERGYSDGCYVSSRLVQEQTIVPLTSNQIFLHLVKVWRQLNGWIWRKVDKDGRNFYRKGDIPTATTFHAGVSKRTQEYPCQVDQLFHVFSSFGDILPTECGEVFTEKGILRLLPRFTQACPRKMGEFFKQKGDTDC
jgi:hypothetical protein